MNHFKRLKKTVITDFCQGNPVVCLQSTSVLVIIS